MVKRINDAPQTMEDIVAPYLAIDGVVAAALVSSEGFLVATAGSHEFDLEALAAHSAAVIATTSGLANELRAGMPKTVTIDLPRGNLILAPLTMDLFLLLLGDSNSVSGKITSLSGRL